MYYEKEQKRIKIVLAYQDSIMVQYGYTLLIHNKFHFESVNETLAVRINIFCIHLGIERSIGLYKCMKYLREFIT